jgi:hypothetical protein
MMVRRLLAGSAGGVAVITALVLPVLVGFTSLSVEVGHWYLVQREMQGAADAAAISAAAEYIAVGLTGTSYQTVGQTYASTNGFTIATTDVCLVTPSGNNCDSTHPRPIMCGSPPCIVVDIAQQQLQMFAPITEPRIKARAIVSLTSRNTPGNGCILALDTTAGAITLQQSSNGTGLLTTCDIASNGGLTFNGANTDLMIEPGMVNGTLVQPALITHLAVPSQCTDTPHQHCLIPGGIDGVGTNNKTFTTATVAIFKSSDVGRTIWINSTTYSVTSFTNASTIGLSTTLASGTGLHWYFTTPTPKVESETVCGGTTGVSCGTVPTDPYAARSFDTPPDTPLSCSTAIQIGMDNPGGTISNPKCYAGTTISGSGTTSFHPYTIFKGTMTINGTVVFSGTPSSDGFYVFDANGTTNTALAFNSGTAWLGAGIYYVRGGGTTALNFTGGTVCAVIASTATTDCPSTNQNFTNANGGITFVMTSPKGSASQVGSVSLSGGSSSKVNLTALCTDSSSCQSRSNQIGNSDTSGLVFFSDRTQTAGGISFSGQVTSTIDGTLYFPKNTVATSGNATFMATFCTQVVGFDVTINGNATFNNGCLPFGGQGIGSTTTTSFRLSQ